MNKTINLKLTDINPDPNNPRQSFDPEEMRTLESSIRQNGVLSPLAVEETKDGYLLIDGERRYRAAKALGLKEVPVVVFPEMTDRDRMIKRFNYQEQHSQWSAWDKANAVHILKVGTGMSDAELAATLGLTKSTILRYETIMNLSKKTAQSVISKKLPVDWLAELGFSIKVTKDEELRSELEEALLKKIDSRLVVRAKELRAYRIAIQYGGLPIVKKIINDDKYTPRMASKDSGSAHSEDYRVLNSCLSTFISLGTEFTSRKNVVLTEAIHNKLDEAKKIAEKLKDLDYEAGRKRNNSLPTV